MRLIFREDIRGIDINRGYDKTLIGIVSKLACNTFTTSKISLGGWYARGDYGYDYSYWEKFGR